MNMGTSVPVIVGRPDKIIVSIKHVYGNRVIYPECDKANVFASIAGTKGLSDKVISDIKRLGFGVEVAQPKPEVI